MPLTLTLTEGVIPAGTEKQAFVRLSEAMLKWHQLTGNEVMTPNITGTVHVLPRAQTFSGMEEVSARGSNGKFPHSPSGAKLPVEQIWINVVHTVDGAWNLNGEAMTNEQLVQAISGEQVSAN